jgi:AmmeMemoRadiSam system protein B
MTEQLTLPDAGTPEVGCELVSLARDTVERNALTDGPSRPTPGSDRGALGTPGDALVAIERGERLRGRCDHLESDSPPGRFVRSAAVDAARNDPRRRPVVLRERDDVTLAVTVLSAPAPLDVDAASAGEPVPDGGRPLGRGERPPAVAGDFYADTAEGIREELAACFRHEQGPGPLEDADVDVGPVTGVVVPHAALAASGPVAAHGYAALADGGAPETVVVFGPNHRGFGAEAAVAPHERWRTALGSVPVDGDLAAAVVGRSAVAEFDDRTHTGEHSIEVQLPFLQHVLPDVSVVPIALSRPGRERAEQVGCDVAAAVEATGRDAAVVSSTDLTHYEPHGRAVETDDPLVDAIASFDVAAIAEAVEAGHTMCGPWATVAGLTAARELGAREGHRLAYATSGQTAGERERVVGYCAVALS